jgi:ABC-type glycerol-3-phosphate transport system permease component
VGVMATNEARQPEGKARPVARKRRRGERVFLYLVFVVAILYSVFPLIAMSFDAAGANIAALFAMMGGAPFSRGAFYFTPVIYEAALSLAAFPTYALNSLTIAALSVGAALAVGIPVSYILARVDIKGKGAVSFVLFALRTISPFAVVLPLYIFFTKIGLRDTYQGVALAEILFVLTVVVWMVKGFFADIPRQVYDAASVFTPSEGQIFRQVALPLVAGGVAVTAVFGIVLISGNVINLEAAATVAYIPALVVMLAIRKYLAKGFSLATAR